MENFEGIPENPTVEQTNAKASPFADSPYVINLLDEPSAVNTATPQKKKERKRSKTVLAGILVITLVIVSCGITGFAVTGILNAHTEEIVDEFQKQIADLEKKIESNSFTGNGNSISGTPGSSSGLTAGQVYAQNKNSVVAISNQGITANIFGQIAETASAGSGFIISSDGYIVTNYHVIKDAKTLTVITSDSTEYNATIIGYDHGNDFALIKINATDLPAVKLGSSDDLIEGDQVVAIGNPLGELTNTLTWGIISGKDRDVATNTVISMLQTDAAINPGNSGGPLFNMKGEVIGITTAKVAGDNIEGLNFAIPIDDVKEMITELIEDGHLSTSYMGITINNKRDGVGVLVTGVDANSPAETAGIRVGDLIVGLGDFETKTLTELDKALRKYEPNDTTSVFVYRNRQVLELRITLGEKETVPTA